MIWESHYWKAEVLKISARLQKKLNQKRSADSSFVRFEKDVMVGCFMVRKLFDSEKISFDVERLNIPASKYKLKADEFIDLMNKHRFDEKYEMGNSERISEAPREVGNKIIHSFVFCAAYDSKGITSLFFNSDKSKKVLYEIKLKNLVALFENVATDDIDSFSTSRITEKGVSTSAKVMSKRRGSYCQKVRKYF